jgi:hypothetical protein
MSYAKPHLLRDLQRLDALPLSTAADVEAWYRAARDVVERLRANPEMEVPELVWHYLSDADIRSRDDEYAQAQRERLRVVMRELEKDA